MAGEVTGHFALALQVSNRFVESRLSTPREGQGTQAKRNTSTHTGVWKYGAHNGAGVETRGETERTGDEGRDREKGTGSKGGTRERETDERKRRRVRNEEQQQEHSDS